MSQNTEDYQSMSCATQEFSKHVRKRAFQRGISKACTPMVKALGQEEFDDRGGVRYLMTSAILEKLRRAVGSTQKIAELLGVYGVVSATDNTVITVGHRY